MATADPCTGVKPWVSRRWCARRPAADAVPIERIYPPIVLESTISFEEAAPDADEIACRMDAPPRLPWLVAARREGVVVYAYASAYRARATYRSALEGMPVHHLLLERAPDRGSQAM